MTTYEHGGNISVFAKQYNCTPSEVIDLSSNINFLTPKVDFNDVILGTYPDDKELTQTLAKHYCVQSDQIELFNGGSSAIFSLMRSFPNTTCVIYSPAYLEYKKAALLHGKKVNHINRFKAMDTEVEENSLIIFINPSTPDGHYYDIHTLMERWIAKNCTILIDESFLEFCGGASATGYLQTHDKLYVLKSQTKFYGCAGVRVGIVLSSSENILALTASEPLWKISALDSHFLIQALQDNTFIQESKKRNYTAKAYLALILNNSPLFEEVHESNTNFFLVKLACFTAKEFQEKLIPDKIMVRDCSNFDFLDEMYVRIAVKAISDLHHFKKRITEMLVPK